MHVFTSRNRLAPALIIALAMAVAQPAAGQRQQNASQRLASALLAQPNQDFRLQTEVGFLYRLSEHWRLRYDTELLVNQQMSNIRELELHPGVEYAVTRNLGVLAGYAQYQRFPAQLPSTRGPFEDIAYGLFLGDLSIANRLRTEELFYDTTGALLVRTRYRLSLQHPIPDTPWGVLVSDEIWFNLKTDGTPAPPGFDRNKLYGGVVLELNQRIKASVGYELTSYEPRGTLREVHTLKIGFAFVMN